MLVLFVAFSPRKPAHEQVTFSDFLFMVEKGVVTEIRVQRKVYTFDVVDPRTQRSGTMETIGPRTSLEELRALRPKDAAQAAPKISVE
jgi:hypothetical protein